MKTICMKTNEEITSYEPENFEENYKAYLVDLLSTNYKTYPNKEDAEKERKRIWEQLGGSEIAYSDIYIDPDNKKNEEFYRELSNFLNVSRISRKNNKILSFEANEDPHGMITVYYKNQNGKKHGFTLHSDQLGFSAVPCTYFKQNYPLSRYLEMQRNKSENDQAKAADFLTKYVYTTRTLGGSFLWPESWHRDYNMGRGNGSYIEDRVDLTLLEIKHIYEFRKLESLLPYSRDLLFNRHKNQYADKWFGFFDSFEDYVDFFMFNNFVKATVKNGKKEYMPINILTGKAFETEYPGYKTNTLKEIEDEKQLKAMLERVRNMVEKRTKKMEDLINEYNQTNDTKGEKHENILHE